MNHPQTLQLTSSNVRVCLYEDNLAEALDAFVERVWPTRQSGKSNRGRSHTSPTFLFVRDGDVIGHITSNPVHVWSRGQTSFAYWVVGFMVLPEYRNGPVGPLVVKKVNETLDCAMTLHVEEPALRVFKGLGWAHVGVIPQYVLVLDADRLLDSIRLRAIGVGRLQASFRFDWIAWALERALPRRVLAKLLSATLAVRKWSSALRRPRPVRASVTEEAAFGDDYDALWESVRDRYEAAVVRDRRYLQGRYGDRMTHYRLLACRRQERLLGYCVAKLKQFQGDPRIGNLRVGTIVDCLFDPGTPGVLQALLDSAVGLCRRERVDVVFCTASHRAVGSLLALNGFVRIPGNLNFAIHDRRSAIGMDVMLTSWHLMRGDSDADENF